MGTACVLNRLRSKEEVLYRLEIELAIFGHIGGLFAGGVLEEEYNAVDRTVGKKVLEVLSGWALGYSAPLLPQEFRVEGYQLFELDVFDA